MQITAVRWGTAGGTPPNESSLQLSGGAHEYWTLSFAWHSGLGLALHSKAMERTGLSPFGLKGAMSLTRGDPAFSCLLPLCPAVQRGEGEGWLHGLPALCSWLCRNHKPSPPTRP